MSMGNYAQYADVVEDEFVRESCLDAHEKLMKCFDTDGGLINFEEFANVFDEYAGYDPPTEWDEQEAKRIEQAYEELQTQFHTQTGLDLHIRYHNAEDRGDEVDGGFWEVEGVYAYTPAGEKYKEKIVRKSWTVFG